MGNPVDVKVPFYSRYSTRNKRKPQSLTRMGVGDLHFLRETFSGGLKTFTYDLTYHKKTSLQNDFLLVII